MFSFNIERYLSDPAFDLGLRQFEYRAQPYLEHISQADLDKRYHHIGRNILTLFRPERDNSPIKSYLSSWYWIRKYVHMKAEYARRGSEIPRFEPPFNLELLSLEPRFKPPFPNACAFVVRYGDMNWLPRMLTEGEVIIKRATEFDDETMSEARRDDELRHHTFQSSNRVRITGPDGRQIKAIGDVRTTIELSCNYYMLCTSSELDPTLFPAFPADGCLVIHDVNEFAKRLEKAFAPMMSNRELLHFPIEYIDPYEAGPHHPDSPGAVKSFHYAYQKEYRFAWTPSPDPAPQPTLSAKLGDLRDIAELLSFEDVLIR